MKKCVRGGERIGGKGGKVERTEDTQIVRET